MSFRNPNQDIGHRLTLMDMWYSVADTIFYRGFLAAGGVPETSDEQAVQLMADEFYRTAEMYRIRGPLVVSGESSYRDMYKRIQSRHDYTENDKSVWVETVWDEIVNNVADVTTDLGDPDTSWLPNHREMNHLHPDVIMGILWSVAHIPNETERQDGDESGDEYESDE